MARRKPARVEPLQHEFYGSSRVRHAWWHPDTKDLVVEFPDGNKTRYHDVPRRVFQQFIDAPSAGSFLNAVLTKQHRYEPA